jgi:hypothetical protein
LHICFWYHPKDLKFLHLVEPFVCFLNFVFVWNFSIFASQRNELTLSQSGAQRQDIIFPLVLNRKLMRASEVLIRGRKEPRTGTVSIFNIFPKNNICMSAVLGSQYGATARSTESLIAQLHSQRKFTTPRRENRKIRHENAVLKANERLHKVQELNIYRLIPKTCVQIS